MTFPAWDAFDADPRVKTRHVKVYRWCRRNLDFTEIRGKKRETISEETGVHAADVTRVLKALVQWGYLLEHPKDQDQYAVRRFTLTWSRAEHKQPTFPRGGGKTPPPRSASGDEIAA